MQEAKQLLEKLQNAATREYLPGVASLEHTDAHQEEPPDADHEEAHEPDQEKPAKKPPSYSCARWF